MAEDGGGELGGEVDEGAVAAQPGWDAEAPQSCGVGPGARFAGQATVHTPPQRLEATAADARRAPDVARTRVEQDTDQRLQQPRPVRLPEVSNPGSTCRARARRRSSARATAT
ncbi:hypothetical protein GCM10009827_011730 [Dactylosporangium maewongense]|uniref:Uncharacterized protein n=1 Tax=Dactylosporangium maewongense TaxID=634393 RepID=A0ABN1ZP68_9ACTN